jgi:DNA-binding NarL/FixJ family response regulator
VNTNLSLVQPDSLLQAEEQARVAGLNAATSAPAQMIVLEPQARVRLAIANVVQGASNFSLVAIGATWPEVQAKAKGEWLDIALISVTLDGRAAATLSLIRELRQRQPELQVLVIASPGDEQAIVQAIEAGAVGYLLSDATPAEILTTLRQVREGGSPMSPQIARVLLERMVRLADASAALGAVAAAATAVRFGRRKQDVPPTSPIKLSEREREVLGYLSKGFHYHEIAALLSVSPQTVPTYIKRLYNKLSVHSRGEAVFEAGRMGLLSSQ